MIDTFPLKLRHAVYTLILLLTACTQPSGIKAEHKLTHGRGLDTTSNDLAPLSFSHTDWQERIFAQSTQYEVIQDGDIETLKAMTDASASMLYKVVDIDLTTTPFVQWEWRIENTYDNTNEQKRSGDDFPARVYIAIASKTGSIFPRALTYVWSSNTPLLKSWKNPYTDSVVMLSLQNKQANVGQWVSEKRNLKEDLAKYFDEDITNIKGIAVMSDGDNTGASGVAFYRSLLFTQE